MTTLYLVRHGETDWNAERRYQGSHDIPLNERGRFQAKEVSSYLADVHFAGAYSSDLQRAFETAEIIKHPRPLSVTKYTELREGCFGRFEGKTLDEIHLEFPSLVEHHQKLSSDEKYHYKFFPEMESGSDVVRRSLPIMERIASMHEDQNALVVTHGGLIRSLLFHITRCDWSSLKIQNGGVYRIKYEKNAFRLLGA